MALIYAVRAAAIVHIMYDENKVPQDHPDLVFYTKNLSIFIKNAGREPEEALTLIEAEKPKIIAEHEEWERAQEAAKMTKKP